MLGLNKNKPKGTAMRFTALLLTFVLTGCIGTPAFVINESNDGFSKNKNVIFTSQHNRISTKSLVGGTHIDNTGVFINPTVVKTPDHKKVLLLALQVSNQSFLGSSTGRALLFGRLDSIIFKVNDNDLIELKMGGQASATAGGAYIAGAAAYQDVNESGLAYISKANYMKIVNAKTISCKITGSYQSMIYKHSDISDDFIKNLKTFATTHLN